MNSTLTLFLFFIAIVAVWILFYNLRRKQKEAEEALRKAQLSEEEKAKEQEEEAAKEQAEDSECCGQHEVCEKTNLMNTSLKYEYYDDEELDALAGINPEEYSDEQIAQLREVFETLKEYDVAGWLRSLQMRNIELPEDIKEDALLIVSDLRERENVK